MSIDLRALSESEAEAFERAAVAAYQKLVAKNGTEVGERHFAQDGLARLMMTIGATVPLPSGMVPIPEEYDGPCSVGTYDFDELWM